MIPANKQQITEKYSCFLLSEAGYATFCGYEYENASIHNFHNYGIMAFS